MPMTISSTAAKCIRNARRQPGLHARRRVGRRQVGGSGHDRKDRRIAAQGRVTGDERQRPLGELACESEVLGGPDDIEVRLRSGRREPAAEGSDALGGLCESRSIEQATRGGEPRASPRPAACDRG